MSRRFHERRAAQRLEEQAERQRVVAEASGRPADKGSQTKANKKSCRRFNTYNAFVDAVGRHLQPMDREVWHVVWRFVDGWTNTAELRLSDIAARLNCHNRTVARSLDRLAKAGLIERLKRGTRQGGPSRYRLEPDVTRCLPRLQLHGKRLSGNPKPATNRNAGGRFTT